MIRRIDSGLEGAVARKRGKIDLAIVKIEPRGATPRRDFDADRSIPALGKDHDLAAAQIVEIIDCSAACAAIAIRAI
jgi:hypothetical protein